MLRHKRDKKPAEQFFADIWATALMMLVCE
jgi:hypothetical protein